MVISYAWLNARGINAGSSDHSEASLKTSYSGSTQRST